MGFEEGAHSLPSRLYSGYEGSSPTTNDAGAFFARRTTAVALGILHYFCKLQHPSIVNFFKQCEFIDCSSVSDFSWTFDLLIARLQLLNPSLINNRLADIKQ